MSVSDSNVIYGGAIPANYAEGAKSLGEFYLNKLKQHGNSVLLIDGSTKKQFTANQLRLHSIHLAECLYAAGVRDGDRISICSDNRLEFVSVVFATIFLGATVAPLNTTYSEGEIHHALNLSKPKILFVAPSFVGNIAKAVAHTKFIEKIIVFSGPTTTSLPSGSVTFEQFIANPKVRKTNRDFQCKPQNMREQVGVILCSSGTTGLPKGVQLTHNNLLVGIYAHIHRPRVQENHLTPVIILLSVIPWFHAFGCMALLTMVVENTKVVFLPKFEDRKFLQSVQTYKCNTAFMVTPLMVFMAKSPLVNEYDVSSLRVFWCGAAPLSKELEDAVRDRIGVSLVRQGYGMTEGTLAFTGQTDSRHKDGSVGVMRAGLWGRIVDPDTGKNLGPNEQGELLFKGDAVMKGYIGDSAATQHTIDAEGWLHTGDLGYYDDEHEFFIVDRLKELIKYKGFQVPPAEIEAILLQHPEISDCGVIGLPDDDAGELPLAFVVLQSGAKITAADVIAFVAARTSPAKRLHGGVKFVAEIPKNASGKILRRELRSSVAKKLSKL